MSDISNYIAEVLDEIAPSPAKGEFVEFEITQPSAGEQAMLRRLKRLVISADALLSPEEVIEHVGGRAAIVRAWLRDNVFPLRHPSGRRVYRWGDVVDAMRRAA